MKQVWNLEKLKWICKAARDIPFYLYKDKNPEIFELARAGSCTLKHLYLKNQLAKLGINAKLVHCLFIYDNQKFIFHQWCDYFRCGVEYPHSLLELEVSGNKKWIDITFDNAIASAAPVNTELLTDTPEVVGKLTQIKYACLESRNKTLHFAPGLKKPDFHKINFNLRLIRNKKNGIV